MSLDRRQNHPVRLLRLLPLLVLTALLLIVALPALADEGKSGASPAATSGTVAYQTINSSGPLENIFVGADASYQIDHTADTNFQVYPPTVVPGDYGTFVATSDTLYASDFANHPSTYTAIGGLGAYTAFTPVSQSAVMGVGTVADPYRVVTVVDVGATGLRLTQTDSYVVGEESYRSDIQFSNTGSEEQSIIFYRAMDCYLGGSDRGYGAAFNDTGAITCTQTPNNNPAGRIEQLLPLTGGSRYFEGTYSQVWTWVATRQPFPNTCRCEEQIDNGIGLSWGLVIQAGGSATISHLTTFSPIGNLPLSTQKTADSANSNAGATNGYTITISNPNPGSVTLNSITDMLPPGFSYVAGSSTGATTANPAVDGQTLTWNGPFTVPGDGNLTLHFNVTVTNTPGTYFNNATADAEGFTVSPTGNTAPITVEEMTNVTLGALSSTPGGTITPWLALAGLALAGVAGLAYRRAHRST